MAALLSLIVIRTHPVLVRAVLQKSRPQTASLSFKPFKRKLLKILNGLKMIKTKCIRFDICEWEL
jgi:hypothetical protein